MEQEKRLKIIFLAMLLGQLAFAVVVSQVMPLADTPENQWLPYLVTVILIAAHLASFYFFNHKKQAIATLKTEQQFAAYQTAAIARWAMLESGNFLMLVAAFLTGETYYLILFAVGLLFFARTKPDFNFS